MGSARNRNNEALCRGPVVPEEPQQRAVFGHQKAANQKDGEHGWSSWEVGGRLQTSFYSPDCLPVSTLELKLVNGKVASDAP